MSTDQPTDLHKKIHIRQITAATDAETLLCAKGWFRLADVFKILSPEDPSRYKLAFKQIERLVSQGQDPYATLGYQKDGHRVMVLMERFAPWYQTNPMFHVQKLHPNLKFENFLEIKEGFFRLSEVCKHFGDFLPFSYPTLKREADKRAQTGEQIGILKFDKNYIVVMPHFAKMLGNSWSARGF